MLHMWQEVITLLLEKMLTAMTDNLFSTPVIKNFDKYFKELLDVIACQVSLAPTVR